MINFFVKIVDLKVRDVGDFIYQSVNGSQIRDKLPLSAFFGLVV